MAKSRSGFNWDMSPEVAKKKAEQGSLPAKTSSSQPKTNETIALPKVLKGIQPPPKKETIVTGRGRPAAYPWRLLEVGDAFEVPQDEGARKAVRSTMYNMNNRFAKGKYDRKFEMGKSEDGKEYIWRIA